LCACIQFIFVPLSHQRDSQAVAKLLKKHNIAEEEGVIRNQVVYNNQVVYDNQVKKRKMKTFGTMELNSFQEIKINKKQKVTQQRKKYKL
jgi:precorrin-6B methylase 1